MFRLQFRVLIVCCVAGSLDFCSNAWSQVVQGPGRPNVDAAVAFPGQIEPGGMVFDRRGGPGAGRRSGVRVVVPGPMPSSRRGGVRGYAGAQYSVPQVDSPSNMRVRTYLHHRTEQTILCRQYPATLCHPCTTTAAPTAAAIPTSITKFNQVPRIQAIYTRTTRLESDADSPFGTHQVMVPGAWNRSSCSCVAVWRFVRRGDSRTGTSFFSSPHTGALPRSSHPAGGRNECVAGYAGGSASDCR